MVQKIYSKMHPVSCTNIHHCVTGLVNHRMNNNIKTWIFRKQSITFLRNKKTLILCLRWHILSNYHFVAEAIFNEQNVRVWMTTTKIPIQRSCHQSCSIKKCSGKIREIRKKIPVLVPLFNRAAVLSLQFY